MEKFKKSPKIGEDRDKKYFIFIHLFIWLFNLFIWLFKFILIDLVS